MPYSWRRPNPKICSNFNNASSNPLLFLLKNITAAVPFFLSWENARWNAISASCNQHWMKTFQRGKDGDVGWHGSNTFVPQKPLFSPFPFSYFYSPFAKLGPLKAFTNLERFVWVYWLMRVCAKKNCPQNLLQAIRVTGRILLF